MLEYLESRTLMSGGGWSKHHVGDSTFADGTSARMHNGELTISSSSKDQNLVIMELDATTVPDSSSPGTFLVQNMVTGEDATFDHVDSVQIQTGKGNDTIFFSGKSAAADISTGDGADSVTILDRANVSSEVNAGSGNDQISVVFSRRARIFTGSGDDVVSLQTAAAVDPTLYDFGSARVNVDAGSGHDTFIAYAGEANVYGTHGDDVFLDNSGVNAFHQFNYVGFGRWS
jgi:hypothetical protein